MANWGGSIEVAATTCWPESPIDPDQHHHARRRPFIEGGKRRVSYSERFDDAFYDDHEVFGPPPKRQRFVEVIYNQDIILPPRPPSTSDDRTPFIIIREAGRQSVTPEPPCGPSTIETTASGISIATDDESIDDGGDAAMMSDAEAAQRVEDHLADVRRQSRNSQRERVLKSLICPKSREAEFDIDDAALQSIFYAANEIFFCRQLTQRVAWDWSHISSSKYRNHIIGTTALRKAEKGGFETLIVLSDPILRSGRYNRKLLISTFLHELIHSYLFISCGFNARHCGGHTTGFHRIAQLIDEWVGRDILHLRTIEADLNEFVEVDLREGDCHQRHHMASSHYHHIEDGFTEDFVFLPSEESSAAAPGAGLTMLQQAATTAVTDECTWRPIRFVDRCPAHVQTLTGPPLLRYPPLV